MRRVISPQALYNMSPSMSSQFVSTVKETSSAYVISVQESTYAANQINSVSSTKPFEVFASSASTYFISNFGSSASVHSTEKRIGSRRAGRAPAPKVKWYGDYQASTDVTAQVRRGEVVVVCGPSGSGKSTSIRTVNRSEPIQKGVIEVDGQDIYGGKVHSDTSRSHIGFVFQQFNSFPHSSVSENSMSAPLQSKRARRPEARDRAMQSSDRV
ncbi:hypothetical protein OY671_008997, partial [Metschnikowia pulcherrima]